MRRHRLVLPLSLLLLVAAVDARAEEPARPHIVLFRDEPARGEHGRALGHRVKKQFRRIPALVVDLTPEEAASFRGKSGVRAVEVDEVVHAHSLLPLPGDPLAGQLPSWALNRIGAPDVWGIARGSGELVGIIDSQIDYDHPDLPPPVDAFSFVAGVPLDEPAEARAGMMHGTATAGLIAARDNGFGVVGVAPEADYTFARALGRDGSGTTSAVLEAMEWQLDTGARVINMSLGSGNYNEAQATLVEAAEALDVLIVASAGNNNNNGPNYPASYPTVLSVASVDEDDKRAWFSSYGSTVDLAAPGTSMPDTVPSDFPDARLPGLPANPFAEVGSTIGTVTGTAYFCGCGNWGTTADMCPPEATGHIAVFLIGDQYCGYDNWDDAQYEAADVYAAASILIGDWPMRRGVPGYQMLGIPSVGVAPPDAVATFGALFGSAEPQQVTVETFPFPYASFYGTSASSPLVAGVATLVREVCPKLSAAQVRDVLVKSASPFRVAPTEDIGAGVVSAPGAIQRCREIHDDDGDGIVDAADRCPGSAENDDDGDGVCAADGDCGPSDALSYPGAAERCDGRDNNCDGLVDEGLTCDSQCLSTCGTEAQIFREGCLAGGGDETICNAGASASYDHCVDNCPEAPGCVTMCEREATAITDGCTLADSNIDCDALGAERLELCLPRCEPPCQDDDEDNVCDDIDRCLGTVLPEPVPTVELRAGRYADMDGDGVFNVGGVLSEIGPQDRLSVVDTGGCSCAQVLAASRNDRAKGAGGQERFGCSRMTLDRWIAAQ